jgi:hypothetical protein
MSLRLGFDIDGVLTDFRTAFEAMARGATRLAAAVDPEEAGDEPLSTRAIKRVWTVIKRTPNWWTKLAAYEPAQIARLYALTRQQRWEVVFLTRRPETAGDAVQFQTQWWLESHGFYLPAVVTVPGSRGDLANALRLDMIVDDQLHNCVDIVGASPAKAILVLRARDQQAIRQQAINRGIGVVSSLEEALDVLERAQEVLVERRGRLTRLIDWFQTSGHDEDTLPLKPEAPRPTLQGE